MKKFLTAFLLLCIGTTSVFAKDTYSSDCRYKYVPLHRKKLEQALSSHLPNTERGVVAGDLFFKYLYESDDSSIDCKGFTSVCRVADMDSNSCIKMFNELIDIEENTNKIQAIFDKYCSEHIDECDCKRVINKPTYNPAPTDYTYTDCKLKPEFDSKKILIKETSGEHYKDILWRAHNHDGNCRIAFEGASFSDAKRASFIVMQDAEDTDTCLDLGKGEWEITYKGTKYRRTSACSTSSMEYKPSEAGYICYCKDLNDYGWIKLKDFVSSDLSGRFCAENCSTSCADEAHYNSDFRSKLGIN